MEVSEKNGEGEEYDVCGLADEEADEFDDFGPGHESELGIEGVVSAVTREEAESLGGQPNDERIKQNRERGEGGDVQGICAPRLLTGEVSKKSNAANLMTYRTTCPSVTRLV